QRMSQSSALLSVSMLHVVGLPHTETTAAYLTCAYTQKIVKFCRMMTALGWPIVLYAGEANEAPVAEHVVVATRAQQLDWYGEADFDQPWTIDWTPAARPWVEMNAAVIAHLRARWRPGDIVCLSSGWCQGAI